MSVAVKRFILYNLLSCKNWLKKSIKFILEHFSSLNALSTTFDKKSAVRLLEKSRHSLFCFYLSLSLSVLYLYCSKLEAEKMQDKIFWWSQNFCLCHKFLCDHLDTLDTRREYFSKARILFQGSYYFLWQFFLDAIASLVFTKESHVKDFVKILKIH